MFVWLTWGTYGELRAQHLKTEKLFGESGLEYTSGDFAKKVISIVANRHSFATQIICVNDVYDLEFTIKDDERDRRSMKLQTVPNISIKSEDKFPSSLQFKNILANSSNKVLAALD